MKSQIVCMLAIFVGLCYSENKLARGYNENINWVTLEDGMKTAEEQNKPLMLLIHKSWCGACKALKPQVTTSLDMEKESLNFVMVNTEDDEEPQDSQYSPDGGYIPRVFFLSPGGKVVEKLYNEEGNPSYKYYYSDAESLASAMKRANDYFQTTAGKSVDEL